MKEIEILNYIHDTLDSRFFDCVSYFTEYAFKTEILWLIISVVLLKFRRTRPVGVVLFIALVMEFSIVFITKIYTDAPRPFEVYHVDALFDNFEFGSFPSGHTALAFTLATVFSTFHKKAAVPLFGMAILVGITRMYSYSHFPIDVVVGAYIGTICAVMTFILVYRMTVWPIFVPVDDEDREDDPVTSAPSAK